MIVKLVGLAAAEIVVYALLRRVKPEYAVVSEIACVAAAMLMLAGETDDLFLFFSQALEGAGIGTEYGALLMKVLGTALLTQTAASAARDNGQSALAEGVEFAGKVLIAALSLPVLKAVLQLVLSLSQNG